jgi:hypothetical protein
MRKVLGLAAGLALLTLAACAPPAPLTAYDFPALGFSASFPAKPEQTDEPLPGGGDEVGVDGQAAARDFAVTITEVDPGRDIDALSETASQAMAKRIGGEAEHPTYCATAEGLLGRELILDKNGQPAIKVRFYLVGARFYIMIARSDFGVQDPAVDDFLTSFHAGKPAATHG